MVVKVNNADWNALSEADKAKINEIISNNFDGETVEGDSETTAQMSVNSACESACNIAESAAVAACNSVPFPGNLVCVAAAHEAGKFCRSRC